MRGRAAKDGKGGFVIFNFECLILPRGCGPEAGRGRDAPTRGRGELRETLFKKLSGTKVYLTFWEVDFQNSDLELDAGSVNLAGATAKEGATGGIEGEKITGESGDVDKA